MWMFELINDLPCQMSDIHVIYLFVNTRDYITIGLLSNQIVTYKVLLAVGKVH